MAHRCQLHITRTNSKPGLNTLNKSLSRNMSENWLDYWTELCMIFTRHSSVLKASQMFECVRIASEELKH